jgi:hypothetical protein
MTVIDAVLMSTQLGPPAGGLDYAGSSWTDGIPAGEATASVET